MDGTTTAVERLFNIIAELEDGTECEELHRIYGDSGDSCQGRLCGECRNKALRAAATTVKLDMLIMKLEIKCLRERLEDHNDIVEWVYDNGGIESVEKRLMPEGMEWPTVDGKPVDFTTGYEPSLGVLETVSIYSNGACEVMGHDGIIKGVDEIHIAKPKVLDADGVECHVGDAVWWVSNKTGNFRIIRIEPDGKCAIRDDDPDEPCGMTVPSTELIHRRPVLDADGVEIRVGDKLYDTESGCGRTVRSVNADGTVEFDGHENRGWFTKFLTHRTPVLSADGKPLREGDVVWSKASGDRYRIEKISRFHDGIWAVDDEGNTVFFVPEQLTHRAPVLAADGKPLVEGETVWGADGGTYLVTGAHDGEVFARHVGGSFGAEVESAGGEGLYRLRADCLTHERPDSWERLEEDALKDGIGYFRCGRECSTCRIPDELGISSANYGIIAACAYAQRKDLVRRAKKLAGVER